jgi:carbonic anhydrase
MSTSGPGTTTSVKRPKKDKTPKEATAPKASSKVKTAVVPAQRAAWDDRSARAWSRLEAGNRRWAEGTSEAGPSRSPQRRAELVDGQAPFALVIGCADSRVPAELLFDQGIGDLFVVRTAGHALDEAVLGSVEYGVAVLGVDLIVILGHQSCGAVAAAAQTLDQGAIPGGYIRGLVERLTCDIASGQRAGLSDLDDLGRYHTRSTVDLLRQRSSIVNDAVNSAGLGIMPVVYELESGLARPVTD